MGRKAGNRAGQQGYTSILEPLTGHEADLKEELFLLKDGIRGVMDGILKQDSTNRQVGIF